jgi:Peptidase_C39 like family
MNLRLSVSLSALILSLASGCATHRPDTLAHNIAATAPDRCAFIGCKDFSKFKISPTTNDDVWVLTSPEFTVPVNWDELVASWNVPPGVYLKAEARAIFPDHATKYYTFGLWSDDPARFPRESVSGQRDDDGTVSIDTLMLKRHGGKVQIRLTLGSMVAKQRPAIKFLGLSFCDSQAQPPPREPNRAAWGKIIDVPERRQAEYEGGGGWCSPTSLSMVMAYWSDVMHRPELNHTVPETAEAINDAVLDGTGNWPFNTAFAGEFRGMRAYVTRLDDISELEDWIVAGITPIVSVSSYLTNNRTSGPDNGHLIVCCGFTSDGDFVANDPGVSVKKAVRARRVYPRERFINAWSKSKNAVYLVYPETMKPPQTRPEHWDH